MGCLRGIPVSLAQSTHVGSGDVLEGSRIWLNVGQKEIRAEDLPIVMFCPKNGGVRV